MSIPQLVVRRPPTAVMLLVLVCGLVYQPVKAQQRFEYLSYKDIDQLFEQLDYTPETWQAGIREVPRVYLTDVSDKWRDKYTKEISVTHKKRLFFRAMTPLVLRSNELILEDRAALKELRTAAVNGQLSSEQQSQLTDIALRFRVINEKTDTIGESDFTELWRRVDIVPVSLALSQSAEESGWGTSRFAAEGNSLFGQWSWGKGITPKEQRTSDKGDYRIAAFETPLDSVRGYTMNLNTHNAYRELRQKRAELRQAGKPIHGADLVSTLNRYSERGEAYVDSLRSIMSYNKLDPADDAYLSDGQAIELVPVDSYSNATACAQAEQLKGKTAATSAC